MNGPVRRLADTQIVIWYVTDPQRLTATAIRAIEEATERDEAIGVLAFALVEMIYAVEKTTNPLTEEDSESIVRVLAHPESPFEVIPLDAAIAGRSGRCRGNRARIREIVLSSPQRRCSERRSSPLIATFRR